MGIDRRSFDPNPAMVLGGIDPGVTPARDGLRLQHDRQRRRCGSAASSTRASAPTTRWATSHRSRSARSASPTARSRRRQGPQREGAARVPESVAGSDRRSFAQRRSAAPASWPRRQRCRWGKTGTTDNNGDAWFCGGTDALHRLRLGRPRAHQHADGDRVRRRPGRRRYLPGDDLEPGDQAESHLRGSTRTSKNDGDGDSGPTSDGPVAPPTTPSAAPAATAPAERRRRRRRGRGRGPPRPPPLRRRAARPGGSGTGGTGL